MRVQDYIVRVLADKPDLTAMQLVVAIRNDYRRKVGISAVRYALDQLYRWNVIGRKRNSYNFVHLVKIVAYGTAGHQSFGVRPGR